MCAQEACIVTTSVCCVATGYKPCRTYLAVLAGKPVTKSELSNTGKMYLLHLNINLFIFYTEVQLHSSSQFH